MPAGGATSVIAEPVTGAAKAAVFLMGVGSQLSAELLRKLDTGEIRRVTAAIAALEAVAPRQVVSVFREFESLTGPSRVFAAKGGDANAPAMSGANPESQPPRNTDARRLAAVLRTQNPPAIALVLANLTPEAGGSLLTALPAQLQAQAALSMAALEPVPPEVFRNITGVIGPRLQAIRQVSRSDSIRSLTSLLNHVDAELAESVLSYIERENQGAAGSLREIMFTFEDVLTIDRQSMKALVARVNRKVLALALKGSVETMRAHFTQCMSQTAAGMLLEDMQALGPVRIRDVQDAQQQVVALVWRLRQRSGIASSRSTGDEYVV
jgi:flagellar motor switch protein FliG